MRGKITAGILAYFAILSLSRMLVRAENFQPLLDNSIFSIFIWLAIWKFFLETSKLIQRRALIFSLILGGIFSAFMVLGVNILYEETTGINHAKTFGIILGGTPFFAAFLIWIFNFFDEFKISANESVDVKKFFLISWALIFAAWIPGLLAQFPGIFAYDSTGQIVLYRDSLIHFMHPPIHTALFGFCTSTLGEFLGSYERGFLIYTLLQMLILAAVEAAILAYMAAQNLPKVFRICWLIFFMFFPLNSIMAISATKDVLFSAFFAAMLLIFFMLKENPSKRFYAVAILICFLCISFRSQGIYVFAFGIFFGILIMKAQRRQLFKIAAASFGLYFLYVNILTGFFDGKRDFVYSLHEMVSVPVVQISRVAVLRQNELSVAEIELIKKYIPSFEDYRAENLRGCSDPVRGLFQAQLFYDNPREFLNLWKDFALKYPLDYFDAFCRLTCGQWYPDLSFRKYYDGQPYFQYESFKRDAENYVVVERGDRQDRLFFDDGTSSVILIQNKTFKGFNWLHDFYFRLAYKNSYERVPVISMLFSAGFTFWLILILIFYCAYKKYWRALFPAAFIIGLWLTMILGPLTLYRYTFPLLLTIPIFLTYILNRE